MKKYKISVIIPVYKVEDYLERCIQSILNQTYETWECILVDDGSPDSCPEICDMYAAKDNRICVIHQKNQGVSVARNCGLQMATGDIVTFVDSDDWLEKDAFETMNQLWTEDKDVIIFEFYEGDENNKQEVKFFLQDTIDFKNDLKYSLECLERAILTTYSETKKTHYIGGPCGKAYAAGKIKSLGFKKDVYLHEDRCMNLDFITRYSRAFYYGKPLYNYFMNTSSATTAVYKENGERVLKNERASQIYIDSIYLKNDEHDTKMKVHFSYLSIQTILCWTAFEKDRKLRKRGHKYCEDLIRNVNPCWGYELPVVAVIVFILCKMKGYFLVEFLIRTRKRVKLLKKTH